MPNSDIKNGITSDINTIREALADMPTIWDGKECILKLKECNYHWRQMEWIGWYFEMECGNRLRKKDFEIPGNRYGKTDFDACHAINWDMKAHAIKSHTHTAILNDVDAINNAIKDKGAYGVIMALLDVEYNDEDRTFQKWHEDLKGGMSDYTKKRIERNASSRYRKRYAELQQIVIYVITNKNKEYLGIHKQGINSNGNPRPRKYAIDIDIFSGGIFVFNSVRGK